MPVEHKDRGIRLSRMAFMPLKWFLRMLEGWKWNCGVFIPSDMLFSPPCLPRPCYNFISSPSNSSSCNSSVGPLGSSPRRQRRTSLTSARLQPQLQQSGGLFSSPGFLCGWALHKTPAGFYWASLQWEIWFCFPQISVFSFSSNKNTKEINCFFKGTTDWTKCVFSLLSFSPKSLNKIVR